jgi:RNA polymerase sigma factor (sigma-70 family)
MTTEWRLTPLAFERLLMALDADRERAAMAYELLRHRIVGLMRWWGALPAEELADQTLDRVARKLEEGATIQEGSFGAYVRGVARMIFYEWIRSSRAQLPEQALVVSTDPGQEDALRRLDEALESLEPAERMLVLRYYGHGKKAEVRRSLADELRLSPTALRIRTHRLRQRLEALMTGGSRKL